MPTASLLALGLCWPSAPASACSYSPVTPRLLTADLAVSGPIVFVVECLEDPFCSEGTPSIRLRQAGSELAGSVHILHGPDQLYALFHPSSELEEGSQYSVELHNESLLLFQRSLTAKALAPLPAPAPASVPVTLSADPYPVGQEYCCGGGLACFATCFTAEARIEATLSTPAPSAPVALYRMRWTEQDGSTHESPWNTRPIARLAQPATQYCATLDGMNLVDKTIISHEVCKDGTSEMQVGTHVPAKPDAHLPSFDCYGPPKAAGLETPAQVVDLWCATWQAACEHERFPHCPPVNVADRCNITLPPEPEDPVEDTPAEDDAAAPPPADEPTDNEPARDAPRPKAASCATQPLATQSGPTAWPSALLALFSLAYTLRSRKRHNQASPHQA